MKKTSYFLPALVIVIIELIIYFWTKNKTTVDPEFYLLTSRYSARVSFAMIIYALYWVASDGLYKIFSSPKALKNFKILVAMLMLNHLIHFYFLFMNYSVTAQSLIRVKSAFGFLGYLAIIILPLKIHGKKALNKNLFRGIHTYLFVISGICLGKYLGRVVDVSCWEIDVLIVTFVILLVVGLVWNVFGLIKDGKSPLK